MKKIFVFWTIFVSLFLFSQKQNTKTLSTNKPNGYVINIKTENLAGKTIKISIYNGNYKQVYKLDSITVKNNAENVSFKQKQRIISAIYQISITGTSRKSDIFIDNGTVVNFTLNGENVENITTDNEINKTFLEFQKMPNSENKNLILKNLQAKFPQNIALKYFTLFELRKSWKRTNETDGVAFRKKILNGIDFNEKVIQLLPNVYPFLNNYFTALPINNENYISGVNLLLAKQNCDSPNFKFYVNWIFKNLELHQSQDIKETAQYVFNQYINNKTCLEKQKTFYDNIFQKVSSFTKLPVGAVLPDFEMINMNKELFKFSEFKKEKVNIVMFYDPLCEHCQTEVPKIGKEIEELEKETNMKIGKLAILNGNANALWNDFVQKNYIKDWINVTYKNGDTKTQEHLDAFANPKFYILDKDGKILTKVYGYSFVRTQLLK